MTARILIVEDNPANLELARYLLTAYGYEVLTAQDGAQGLRVLREDRPEAVLCDLHMPGLDGYGVVAEIRKDSGLRGCTVIAVTASSMSADRQSAMAAGFDGFISKPIDAETFVAEVEAHLPAEHHAQRPRTPGTG